MRLLKTIDHPQLRISIFLHNRRYSIKAEDQLYQEFMTFREDEIEDLDQLVRLINETNYPDQAMKRLAGIHEDRLRILTGQQLSHQSQEEDII